VTILHDLQQVFDVLPYPVFVKNAQHQWIFANKAFDELMGNADYLGKDDRDFFPADQVKVFWTEDRRVFAGEESINEEEIGPDIFALTRKVPFKLPDGTTGLVAIILASVTTTETLNTTKINYEAEIKEAGVQLQRLRETSARRALELEDRLTLAEMNQKMAMTVAQTDPATGLKNRLGFEHDLTASVKSYEAKGKRFGLAIVDIDRFKQINDRFGHPTGDLVLKTVGWRLTELPDVFTVARWGGDEFAILTELPVIDDSRMLQGLEEARQYAFRPIRAAGRRIEISGSVGFSIFSEDARSADELIRNADVALMMAKRRDRGMVQAFDEQISEGLSRRMQLVRDLPDAIANGEIRPFYQPIMGAENRKVRAVEALSRWTHPKYGPVGPDEFLDLAHECGLGSELDASILNIACREVSPWLEDGTIAYLSLNVTPMDIVASDFAERFLDSLARTGTNPKNVCLEIVESAIIGDLDAARANIERLSDAGVMIALDDYGTGFSNLRALLDLPLDKLKIDRSLIQSIGTNIKIADLLTSIMQLAKTLKVGVVAEGIETKLQSAFVTSAGCDLMQGYLFSQALSYDAMKTWLSTDQQKVA
jgi:diguanylate cyclase (GGDEF)-like protein